MSQATFSFEIPRRVYTVSALTQEIRGLLEIKFLDVWVSGEVSNCRSAASGHIYFTLKDDAAQVRVVCFRNQARYLKFKPQDGVSLIARGRLSVYEARGEYQLLAEYLEPAGVGALQLAFDQLKQKLAAEGLFSAERKKPLPMLPRTVGVVTSPSGAVIRDIVRVLCRRFPNVNVLLYPARVQGEGAAAEIARGVRYMNQHQLVDALIVARGGGSIEDLWPFNEEVVARAIAASSIPVISAVGHETDFTISDFVADLRAPTPSAAAELVIHCKEDFEADVRNRQRRMNQIVRLKLSELHRGLAALSLHWVFQAMSTRLAQRAQRLDDLSDRLTRAALGRISAERARAHKVSSGIVRVDLRRVIEVKRGRLEQKEDALGACVARRLTEHRRRWAHAHVLLEERSPQAILKRGYAVARDAAGRVIRSAAAAPAGSEISVQLAEGRLDATVRGSEPPQ
ncbi:MAG: exodeoxyribonuclease VII large subunit [Terriglobia bacterium]